MTSFGGEAYLSGGPRRRTWRTERILYIATGPLDLRRSFDGLAAVTREVLRQDPLSGALFLFFDKAHNRGKILWWDPTGYCLLYKRLERGAFRVPKALPPGATSVAIDAAEMKSILEGVALLPTRFRAPSQAA
jgi:transposase